ncbi:MAG: ubiquitin-like domain-containing protein [Anaerolineaceae bacterium]|nr:ubiquitin-like domain-containing protein [Anaerolineaceae bacterium]
MKKSSVSFFKKYNLWPLALLMILSGLAMLTFSLRRTLLIQVDQEQRVVQSFAIRPIDVLNEAGITLSQEDIVIPPRQRLFFKSNTIQVIRAQSIQIVSEDLSVELQSPEKIPVNLLQEGGIAFYPNDRIMINGLEIDSYRPILIQNLGVLQFRKAQAVTLVIDDETIIFYSSQPTLGMALEEIEILIHPKDTLSQSLDTPLISPISLEIRRARELSIEVDGVLLNSRSSALTVGEALQDIGLSLQGLDFSTPDEQVPIPNDGKIKVIRVSEALVIEKEETPFTSDYQPDPNTEIDQYSVLQPGQVGLVINRTRIKYAEGKEISRDIDPSWQASEASKGTIGYGTKVVVRTAVVDGQTIEYWRKISVYATSYAPCKQGYSYCTTATASGIPLEKGIVAVLVSWYRDMKFQQVYIPGYGYGTIADTGGGIPGRPWIDLGFSEADYESWHFWTTLYFLTPVPQYIPYLLP